MVGESATSETPATVLSLFFSTPKRLGATHYCVTCRALSNSFALELLTHAASIKKNTTQSARHHQSDQNSYSNNSPCINTFESIEQIIATLIM